MNLKISFAYPGVAYDPDRGLFYRLFLSSTGEVQPEKELFADEFLSINYKCFRQKKIVKKKAMILAWEIMKGAVPEGCVLYAKNFDKEDFRISNIGCMPREDYKVLKYHIENMNGAIKIKPHKTDAFVQVVEYKYLNKTRKVTVHDVSTAMRLKKIILLKAARALSKYYISN